MKCPKCEAETKPYWTGGTHTFYYKCPECDYLWDRDSTKYDDGEEDEK